MEGRTSVRRALLDVSHSNEQGVVVRTLAGDAGGGSLHSYTGSSDTSSTEQVGASTFSPMTIAHIELQGLGSQHVVPLRDGWTCIVYVRGGVVEVGGREAKIHETVYMQRGGGDLLLKNAQKEGSDVMVFAGEPIGAPVVASGTMVMNSQAEVNRAIADYQMGTFGEPWDHNLSDEEWREWCASRPV